MAIGQVNIDDLYRENHRMSFDQFNQLFACLNAAQTPPPSGSLQLGSFPDVGTLPLPEETWTLIDLVRHYERQQWLGQIVRENLKGHEGSGIVPGLIDWEYRFHGIGCELTHRVTGEQIDVDFYDNAVEAIDVHFYTKFLQSLRHPDAVAQRVLDLHPNVDAIRLDIISLVQHGPIVAVRPMSYVAMSQEMKQAFELDPNPVQPSDAVVESRELVSNFCRQWEDAHRRLWLAAMIGDWPLVSSIWSKEASCDKAFAEAARSRAMECHQRRINQIDQFLKHPTIGYLGLFALEASHPSELAEQLKNALRGPFSGTTSVAMEMINKMNDQSWCPQVLELLDRLDPDGDVPQPAVYSKCLSFLLTHGCQTQHVVEKLAGAGDDSLDEASLLALEHVPSVALSLIRRGLRCGTPYVRHKTAAILGILDRPWSRRELLTALKESQEDRISGEYARALRESVDPGCREAGMSWEDKFSETDDPIMRLFADRVSGDLEDLHDRVMPLRRLDFSERTSS